MPIYEYLCANCNTLTEDLRKVDEREIPAVCPDCGEPARYIISAPRVDLEGITGDFPGAADKWVKKREQKQRQEARKSYYKD